MSVDNEHRQHETRVIFAALQDLRRSSRNKLSGATIVRKMIRSHGLRRRNTAGVLVGGDMIDINDAARRLDEIIFAVSPYEALDMAWDLHNQGWGIVLDAEPISLPPLIPMNPRSATERKAHRMVADLRHLLSVRTHRALDDSVQLDARGIEDLKLLNSILDLIDEMVDFPAVEVVYELLTRGMVIDDESLKLRVGVTPQPNERPLLAQLYPETLSRDLPDIDGGTTFSI